MNKEAVFHMMESQWANPIDVDEIIIRLRTAKEKLDAYLVYGWQFDVPIVWNEIKMEVAYEDELFYYYETRIRLDDRRLCYVFKINDGHNDYYFSEDGLSENYDLADAYYNFFQMPYINEADLFPTVAWMKEAVFYQIFVDRFARANFSKDDSYINMAWEDKPSPTSFAGGDLLGIVDKLDYLKDLGVNAIYLTPIFRSNSNHKYDIIDYFKIDPHFGNEEDFRKLVDNIHARGMKLVLDGVFNHMSKDNLIFQDALEKYKDSDYFDWFYINEDKTYETFAKVTAMPKINTSNERVQKYLIDVGKYWIEKFDIDGWRLDVSDEISHDFWRAFRKEIKGLKKDAVILGENWHDGSSFLMGDQFDSIMNYSFTKASLDFFKGEIDARAMAFRLNRVLVRNKDQVNRMNLNFLDTHDTLRFLTEVDGSEDKLLSGIALMTVFMGTTCMYYGTEIGLEGGYDPDCRRSFIWDRLGEKENLIIKIKEIFSLKSKEPIKEGGIRVKSDEGLLIIERFYGSSEIKLVINLKDARQIDLGDFNILTSNRYEEGSLLENSFIVLEKNSKHL
ncbi:glycoside hydrolase family 13 protein [Anaerococcus sp.]|uniref:glycoside hydrolase family 13 protein n=1 Tax=Anaerococcus sp. TaxID=1872515 RepID=UPI002A760674|nr:glycoside hydrolase family 13 protein [Anaerococcus sp.]MDD6918815.1 glycoside hydrolase family 13 protein [Peptoniphilaceae bacterium]MDY2928442.1 glycoside hydrolase family 13 protein [Anaerococcus sp.]